MNPFPKPETAGAGANAGATDPMRQPAQVRPEAVLVPFPAPGARRRRRSPPADGRRGEILFFLGVRYERLAS